MYPRKENRSERVKQQSKARQATDLREDSKRLPGRISGNKLKNPGKMTDFLKKCCQNWVMKKEVKNLNQ